MFCPKCGKKVADDAQFCQFCGTPIGSVSRANEAPVEEEDDSGFSIEKILEIGVGFLICVVLAVGAITYFVLSHKQDSAPKSSGTQVETTKDSGASAQKQQKDKKLHQETLKDGTEVTYGVVSNVRIAVVDAVEVNHAIGNATPQGKFIVTRVLFGNDRNEAIEVIENNYRLVDKDGREYSTSFEGRTAWKLKNGYQGINNKINPGNSNAFVYIYDVPESVALQDLKMKAQGDKFMGGKTVVIPFNHVPSYAIE